MFENGLYADNFSAGVAEDFSAPRYDEVSQLIKAIVAGDTKGGAVTGLNSGPGLKLESLESTLKTLSYDMKKFTLYNMIGKKKAYSTAEEYNQLDNYGAESAYFIGEGELPESQDSQYQRLVETVKFMGTTRQVTDVAMRVRAQIPSLILQEEKNGMLYLGKGCNYFLYHGNEKIVPKQFNGMYYNHRKGLVGATGTNLSYATSPFVVDLRGKVLQDGNVDDAVNSIVNLGYGEISDIWAPPSVFADYAKTKVSLRRTVSADQVKNGVYGSRVESIITQFGDVTVRNDVFARRTTPRYTSGTTAGKRHAKAPEAVTPDGSTPLAAVSDSTGTHFGDSAGDYFVAVAAVNEYGEGALTALSASKVTVSTTQSIDMLFTMVDGAYPATGFVIYRSEKSPTSALADTPLYPVFSVSKTELAAGFDGGAAGYVRDRNFDIPNTEIAFVAMNDPDQVFAMKELSPMMKMDLALTSLTHRFVIAYYLTNILYAPKKVAVIKNIGKILPS